MRILNVAFPFAPVRPDSVGGAEQVLARIDEALTEGGHSSFVLACEGSQVRGTLIETPLPAGMIDPRSVIATHELYRKQIDRIVLEEGIDVVHFHGIDFLDYVSHEHSSLATLHLPLDWYPQAVWTLPASVHLHCVSHAQLANAPRRVSEIPIENGVRLQETAHEAREDFCLFLGRICPEKGIHHAIAACREAGTRLVIAGKTFPYAEHLAYFEDVIAPHLCDDIRHVGPVEGARKANLLASARALLVPSLVPETSSLVAMEAAAAGTPVIAFPAGALCEIVEDGRTGFLVDDDRDMARSILQAHAIDPEDCRQKAARDFSVERMCGKYIARYQQIIAERRQ